ncbi:MAG TPA: hypothetical protein VJX67_24600 [Blastocatellia bacterium]|nr:hypothetical protein [Blastocatellia bacterium]
MAISPEAPYLRKYSSAYIFIFAFSFENEQGEVAIAGPLTTWQLEACDWMLVIGVAILVRPAWHGYW